MKSFSTILPSILYRAYKGVISCTYLHILPVNTVINLKTMFSVEIRFFVIEIINLSNATFTKFEML